jgi:hypothetical protein
MRTKSQERASVITLQAHPPERRRRQSTELLSQLNGCCCCCCCCCLHSLGSLVGAAWASASASRGSPADANQSLIKFPDDEIDGWAQNPLARIPVNRIYWSLVVSVSGLVLLYLMARPQAFPDPLGYLLVLAIFLPLVQLGASVLSAFVIACFPPDRYQKGRAWAVLGRITAWTLIGAVIGSLIMVLAFFLLTHR